MPKISVIIPVYNDPVYIKRGIESLLKQTFNDIEIIVVDDGSTDETPSIIEEYSKNDSRIKLLRQENKKQGAARNNGLRYAQSEYVMFMDSDDWVNETYCEDLYNAIVKYDVDMALSSVQRIKENGQTKIYYDFKEEKVYSGYDEIIKITRVPKLWQVWGRLYKKELLAGIEFEENVFYEDPEYLIKVIHKTKSLVTVPSAMHYYYSNPVSTMKKKHTIAKRYDQISSIIKVFEYAQKNNLDLPPMMIEREKHLLWAIKHFTNKKEFYFLGVKLFTKWEVFDTAKNFLVFNTSCFGDVLLCNSLCQNIKNIYPNSKITFIVDKPFYDVAKYQKDVDNVVIYDKRVEHKGLLGLIKFISQFKGEKDFLASFITYKNIRNLLIAKLLKSKYIFEWVRPKEPISTQIMHNNLLKNLTHKPIVNYPIRYKVNDINWIELKSKLNLPNEYVVISPKSKKISKDMPFETLRDLIAKLDKNIVLVGVGKDCEDLANRLKQAGCSFINLVGKTNIPELALVVENSECLISVDTGTLHLGCAVQIPTVAVFYEKNMDKKWAPDSSLYNSILINENQTAENIVSKTINLLNKEVANA